MKYITIHVAVRLAKKADEDRKKSVSSTELASREA